MINVLAYVISQGAPGESGLGGGPGGTGTEVFRRALNVSTGRSLGFALL